MKRTLGLFLALVMIFTMLPANIYAAGPNYEKTETVLELSSSDSFMKSVFGSEIGNGTETDEGYVYEMSPELLDEFVKPLENVASAEGISLDSTDTVQSNELPDDYVDDSNVELAAIQQQLKLNPSMDLLSDESERVKVDVVFVIDSTGSMSSAIRGVKTNVATFAQYLAGKGLTLRLGLIDFRDITYDGNDSTVIHKAYSSPWMNVDNFLNELSKVSVSGGGDYAETPIDALGYLTKGSYINWSSDAYKFAILITDAPYKNNNNHSISSMSSMTSLLSDREIQTSVITTTSNFGVYGELAMMTGGFTANINGNFSTLLGNYADAVIGTTLPIKEYSVQIVDSVMDKPVSNATISWSDGSAITNSSGITTISTRENPITDIIIKHSVYGSKNISSLNLDDGKTTKIYISTNAAGKEPLPDDGTPVFNENSLPVMGSGSETVSAPKINIFGKSFALINTKIGFNIPFFDDCEISHNAKEKKFEVIFGRSVGEKKEDDDPYWKSDYQKYKSLVQAFNKDLPAKDIYNNFRSLRKEAKAEAPKKGKMFFPFDMTIGGYGELSYAPDADKYFEGGVIVCASVHDISIIKDWPLPPAPYVFLNLKFKVDVTGKVGLIIVEKNPVSLGTPNVNIEIAPTLDLSVALGAPKIASIGGGGTLTLKGSVQIPFKSMRDSLSAKLSGTGYIFVKILGFEKKESIPLGDGKQFWPPAEATASLYSYDSSIELSDFKLIQRNNTSDYNMIPLSITDDDFIYYGHNSYENSSPELIKLSDGRCLLIWIGDDRTREYSSDKAALMYSIYNGSTWSEPTVLDDDGTADYNPTVIEHENGIVSIVWQDSTKAFNVNDMTLEEALENIDISYAKLNVSTNALLENQVVSVPDNGTYKMMPMISANDNEVNVIWIENSVNDPLMFNGLNSIKSVTKSTTGNWSDVQTRIDGLSTITSMTMSYVDEENVIAYVEGNYSTEHDQIINSNKIYLLKDSGNSEITVISEEDIENIETDNLSYGANKVQFSGEGLYWNDCLGVRMINLTDPENVITVNKYGNEDFEIFENQAGNRAIISVVSEGVLNNIYASYEANDGSWNAPVKITDYDKNIRDISGFYDSDGKVYLAFNQNDVIESDGKVSIGETDLVVAALLPEEDILVYPEALVANSSVIPGEDVNITLTMSNMGAQKSKPLMATIYCGGKVASTINSFVAYKEVDSKYEPYTLNTINGGETVEVDIPFTVPADLVSPQNLEIVISSQDGTSTGIANKKASATIKPFADLSVNNVELSKTTAKTKITATVKNDGYTKAENISVSLYNESGYANGEKLSSKSITLLNAGSEKAVEFEIDGSLLESTSEFDYKRFIVEAEFDGEEWILENNTSNTLISPEKTKKVILDDEEITLNVGNTKTLEYTIENENAANKSINWLSSDTRVVTVSDGKIQALKKGTVTITAIPSDGGEADEVVVTVLGDSVSVNSVEITGEKSSMTVGESIEVSALIKPDNATNKNVTWYTTDERIIDVTPNGTSCTIHAISNGQASVNVVTSDGSYSDSVTITVTGTAIHVTDLTVSPTTKKISVGSTAKLTATISPKNATNKNVKWSVADDSIASITVADNVCTVKALKVGTTDIFAVTVDGGYSAVVKITVTKKSSTTGGGGGGGGGGGASATPVTVKYETNGGSKIANSGVLKNSTLTAPAAPTKDGFAFDGWYTDKELTKAYDFSQKVTKDFTLYAKWIDIEKVQIILQIGKKAAKIFGKTKENDVAPKIVNDRTVLPIRFIAEALGATVEWNGDKREVTITKGETIIIITIDKDSAKVNGKKVELDCSAFIENDRTYLPLRFVSENLGAKVEWLDKTMEVVITK